jgi:drug/metabolite transporter (DMT)-like permease
MLAAAVGFTVMTSLIKYLGADYPAALQTFYRSAASFVFLLPIILRDPKAAYRTTRPGVMLFRGGVGAFALILSFYSFQKLPLADANALSFTRTLWIVPLAAFVLKEEVGPARIGAAVVGFLGVLLMLAPMADAGTMQLGVAQIAALSAAFLFALTVTGLKSIASEHTALQILTWSATLGVIFAIVPAMFVWRWPTLPDFLLLSTMGVIGIFTQYCFTRGMQVGDAAAMAPIDYTRLVFATASGYFLFSELPTLTTLGGAAIVVGSTLFITWREYVVARRKPEHPMD